MLISNAGSPRHGRVLSFAVLAALITVGVWWASSGVEEEPASPGASEASHLADEGADEGAHSSHLLPVESAPLRDVVEEEQATPVVADAGPGPAAEVPPSHRFRGRVKELGGPGVPGVTVEIVGAQDRSLAATVTAEGGRFEFDRAPPRGSVLVTQLRSGEGPRLRHPRATPSPGASVTLWIPPPAVIEGIVIDGNGRPVEGARVVTDRLANLLTAPPWEGEVPRIPWSVSTDGDGRFVLPGAKAGDHRLRASEGTREGSTECRAGDSNVIIELGAHPDGLMTLEGTVRERVSGAPVADALIHVNIVRNWPGGRSSKGVTSARSDASGRYEVQGLEEGAYALKASAEGHAPEETRAIALDGALNNLDVELDLAREITVSVTYPDGTPAPDTEIRVTDEGGRRLWGPHEARRFLGPLRTGQRGRLKLKLLPARPVTVHALQGDLAAAGEAAVDLGVEPVQPVAITLPSRHRSFARTHYFKLLDEGGAPASIEGTVTAECRLDGELVSRVSGAWVGDEFFFGHERSHGFSTPTIAVGAPEGECQVEISVPGYDRAVLVLEAGASSPTEVRLIR